MPSFPPVGGTTRRSLFAVWAAPIASLPSRRFVARARVDDTHATHDCAPRGNPLSLPSSAAVRSDRVNPPGKGEHRDPAAVALQMAS